MESSAERAIVIADHEADRAQLLAAAVTQARCGRTRIAPDGRQAAALGADAIQVLRDLSGAIDGGLPVLVVTDRDDRPGRRRALAAGARDLVLAVDGNYE